MEIVETVGFRVKRFEEKKEWFNLVVKGVRDGKN